VTADHTGPRRPGVDGDGVPWPDDPPPEDSGELAAVFPLHPPTAPPGRGNTADPGGRGLVIEDLAQVLARVDQAGPPAWLVEGLWPRDAYGVFAAEDKAGKTWAILDLAVSVAAGVPWLGAFTCPPSGRVLVFLGEGGERAMVRRLRAIAVHKQVDLGELAELGLMRLCFRVPKLTSGEELAAIEAELAGRPAALVIVDPLYLAVGAGATGSNLYAMGAVLAAIQGVCQHAGAALVVVTHWNKTGDGTGIQRISGVGPGAWGRVLASAGVAHRTTTPDSGASTVVLAVEVIGAETADQHFRVRRRVWADDPADLASPLHYTVEVLPDTTSAGSAAGTEAGVRPSAQWVLAALRAGGPMQTVKQLGDRTAQAGHPLKERTLQTALGELEAAGLAAGTDPAPGLPRYWSAADPSTPGDPGQAAGPPDAGPGGSDTEGPA
jgi:hypothetical protein